MALDVDKVIEAVVKEGMTLLATEAYRVIPVVPQITRNTPTACVVWKEVDNEQEGMTLDSPSQNSRVVMSVAVASQRRQIAALVSREIADALDYYQPGTVLDYDGVLYTFDRLAYEGRRVDYNGALDLWQGEMVFVTSVSGDEGT